MLVCLVATGATILVFAFQVARASLALRNARAQATQVQKQLSSGDLTSARRSLRELSDSTRSARGASDNLLWDGAAKLPGLGPSIEAVQIISAALDEVSQDSLPVTLELITAAQKGSLQSEDGRIDLAEVRRVTPSLVRAAATVKRENRQLAAIEPGRLLSPMRTPAAELKRRFGTLDRSVATAASAARLLPTMLGGEGQRNYVLVAQNNAELRATGGLPGSVSIISARRGALRQGFQGSATDFPILERPVLPLSSGERQVYGDTLGKDIRDTNRTPDFPRAADLLSTMVASERGVEIDGVIAVDPMALSSILRVTGPIRTGGEEFTADNVVAGVLNESYKRFPDPNDQDEYFAALSGAIFDALVHNRSDLQDLLRGVSSSVDEGRILMWSRHREEQRLIETGKVAGRLPEDTGAVPHVGIYLNDYTVGKMDFYLDYGAELKSVSCGRDRSQGLVARMTLSSAVPRPISDLPVYITGTGRHTPKGSIGVILRIYAPVGGRLTGISVNGEPTKIALGLHDDHQVTTLPLQIDPGQEVEVLASLQTRPRQSGNPVMRWTPGMRRQSDTFEASSACR